MGAPVERAEHRGGSLATGGLAEHAPVEMHGRVHAERDGTVAVNRSGLALRVRADERDGVCVRGVVLHIVGRDGIEGDAELLEDRPALRRARSEDEQVAHRSFSATQISSLGQRRDQSTEWVV